MTFTAQREEKEKNLKNFANNFFMDIILKKKERSWKWVLCCQVHISLKTQKSYFILSLCWNLMNIKSNFLKFITPQWTNCVQACKGNITSEYTNEKGRAVEECCHILKSNQAKPVRWCIIWCDLYLITLLYFASLKWSKYNFQYNMNLIIQYVPLKSWLCLQILRIPHLEVHDT